MALTLSIMALAVSVLAAAYTRRQALAAEQANWGNQPLTFTMRSSGQPGSLMLHLTFNEGVSLDNVNVEILDVDVGPSPGFGAGIADSAVWVVGPIAVGESIRRSLVSRLRQGGSGYQGGELRLRVSCRKQKRERQLSYTVKIPGSLQAL